MRLVFSLQARAGFLPLLMLSGLAGANEEPPKTGMEALDEIVVSASREATGLGKTPAAISQIPAQTIKDSKPAYLHQVLNQAIGVHMIDLGNEQHTMSIRLPVSYSAFYQYLEDNIPIRPIGLFNHNALLETNLAGAASIEVLRGPASSLYGSNAVGGAINFLSKAPAQAPEVSVGVRGSADGYYRLDAGFSDTVGEVGVRFSYYGARNDSSWREHNDYQKDSFTTRADLAVGDASLWRNVLTHNDLDTQMPGSLSPTQFFNTPEVSYQTFSYRRDISTRLTSTLETEWSPRRSTSVTVYMRDGNVKQNPSYSISTAAGTADRNGRINESDYQSLGVDANWRENFTFADSRLIAGLSHDHSPTSTHDAAIRVKRAASLDFVSYTLGGWINVNTGQNCSILGGACQVITTRRDFDTIIDNPSAYAQYELTPVDKLRVVVGLRYDLIRYDYENNIFNPAQAGFGPASEQRDFEHVSPKLGAVYSLTPGIEIYSNLSEGFMPPEISALYGALTTPGLEESVYRNIDFGLRQRFSENRGRYEVAWYRLEGHDEVVSYTPCAVGVACPQGSTPVNAGNTVHEGIEFGLKYAFTEQWDVRFNATVSRHEYEYYSPQAGVSYAGNAMPMAPAAVVNAEIIWKPLPALRFGAEGQHVSRYWMDERNTREYPGYTLLNLRGEYDWRAFEFYMQGLNMTDKRYATTASVSFGSATYSPGDPRMVIAGVNYHFGKKPD